MANPSTCPAPLNSRRGEAGYSLRRSLEAQGVTLESAMKAHLSVVHGTLATNPRFDVTRYRVDPNNPNNLNMG